MIASTTKRQQTFTGNEEQRPQKNSGKEASKEIIMFKVDFSLSCIIVNIFSLGLMLRLFFALPTLETMSMYLVLREAESSVGMLCIQG